MASKTQQQFGKMGYSAAEAKQRAAVVDAGNAAAESAAAGIPAGYSVGVEDGAGIVTGTVGPDGRMTVNGCVRGPGMYGRIVSRPYREVGHDRSRPGDVVGILADGTEVRLADYRSAHDTASYPGVVANGRKYESVRSAAAVLTPA